MNKKEYIEPEVLDENFNNSGFEQKNNYKKDLGDPLSQLKSMVLMRGLVSLILPIIIFTLIIIFIVWLIFIIFSSPFDYILVILFLGFLINLFIKIIKFFK